MSYTGSELNEYPVQIDNGLANGDGGKFTFLYRPEEEGVIPPPTPADKHIDEWCSNIQYDSNINIHKRRLDTVTEIDAAYREGYIISLPGEMAFSEREAETTDEFTFPKVSCSFQSDNYLNEKIHPEDTGLEYPVYELDLRWAMSVPDGYSILITNPFFMKNEKYRIIPEVHDLDVGYKWIEVTLQLHDAAFRVNYGTPIAQVIPIKREGTKLPAVIDRRSPAEK